MISRDGLELDLNVAFHRTTKRVRLLLTISVQVDFVLNILDVLFGADPSGSSAQVREIISINIEHALVTQHVEALVVLVVRRLLMNRLVKVVVHDFAEVDERAFLNLNFAARVQLETRGVHETDVTNKVLAVNLTDHELCFPQLLVVRHVIVTHFTLADLEDGAVTVEADLNILEFLRVDLLELQHEPLLGNVESTEVLHSSLEVATDEALDGHQLGSTERARVLAELVEGRVSSDTVAVHAEVGLNELMATLSVANLELMTQR